MSPRDSRAYSRALCEALLPRRVRAGALREAEMAVRGSGPDLLMKLFYMHGQRGRSRVYRVDNNFVIVEMDPALHASALARMGRGGPLRVLRVTPGQMRRIVRGMVYHSIVESWLVGSGAPLIPEHRIIVEVAGVPVIATLDGLLLLSGNRYVIIEIKSSDSPRTIESGAEQVGVYLALARASGLRVVEAWLYGVDECLVVRRPVDWEIIRRRVMRLRGRCPFCLWAQPYRSGVPRHA